MKQIAVVLGAINLTNQKKILEGMISAAKETNCNLYVFTNYVGTKETPEHITAANRILQLPEFHKFDDELQELYGKDSKVLRSERMAKFLENYITVVKDLFKSFY